MKKFTIWLHYWAPEADSDPVHGLEFKFVRWELRRPAGEKIKTWLYSFESVSHQFYHQNNFLKEFTKSQVLFKDWALRFNENLYFTVVWRGPILKHQGFQIRPMKHICLFKIITWQGLCDSIYTINNNDIIDMIHKNQRQSK